MREMGEKEPDPPDPLTGKDVSEVAERVFGDDGKLQRVKVVAVAFRVQVENSVAYKKVDTPDDAKIGEILNRMIHEDKADFISGRVVRRGP